MCKETTRIWNTRPKEEAIEGNVNVLKILRFSKDGGTRDETTIVHPVCFRGISRSPWPTLEIYAKWMRACARPVLFRGQFTDSARKVERVSALSSADWPARRFSLASLLLSSAPRTSWKTTKSGSVSHSCVARDFMETHGAVSRVAAHPARNQFLPS